MTTTTITDPFQYVSAHQSHPRIKHLGAQCLHFYEDKPPREGTAAELAACRPCQNCDRLLHNAWGLS